MEVSGEGEDRESRREGQREVLCIPVSANLWPQLSLEGVFPGEAKL